MCKIVLKNTSNLDLPPWMISWLAQQNLEVFPAIVSPYAQPNSKQVCFDSIVKPKHASVKKVTWVNREIHSKRNKNMYGEPEEPDYFSY